MVPQNMSIISLVACVTLLLLLESSDRVSAQERVSSQDKVSDQKSNQNEVPEIRLTTTAYEAKTNRPLNLTCEVINYSPSNQVRIDVVFMRDTSSLATFTLTPSSYGNQQMDTNARFVPMPLSDVLVNVQSTNYPRFEITLYPIGTTNNRKDSVLKQNYWCEMLIGNDRNNGLAVYHSQKWYSNGATIQIATTITTTLIFMLVSSLRHFHMISGGQF